MAKVLKIIDDVISIGMDDGSIKKINIKDFNFNPQIGDKVDLVENNSALICTKASEKNKVFSNDINININLSNNQKNNIEPYLYENKSNTNSHLYENNNGTSKLGAIKGAIAFFLYFVLSYGTTIPFKVLGIDYSSLSITFKQIYLILYELFMVGVFIYIYRNELKNEWLDFKDNYKGYFKGYFKYWLFALAIMYASNLIIGILKYKLTGNISAAENEEAIRETLVKAPFYTFIAASICAPIMEELTFRKSLRKLFNNKILFIVISSFIFGALHVFTKNMTFIDLLYLIPYCAPGVIFAYIYVKTDNIFNTISLHFFHNTILMILQVVLLFRGIL